MARVLTCYYLYKPGGYCVRLTRAILALLSEGHEVHYLSLTPFPVDNPLCHFHRFPWPEEKADGLLFWTFFHLSAPLMLLYLGIRYRISHAFAFGTTYAFFMQPLRLIRRIPLTLFLRADVLQGHITKKKASLIIVAEKIIEGFSIMGIRVYGVSENIVESVMARHTVFVPKKYGVLRNDIKSRNVRREWKVNGRLRLAMVGTLDKVKNHRLAIKLMQDLADREGFLRIYGSGSDEKDLKSLVQDKNLESRVGFMGWVDDMNGEWRNIDLLLMPSHHEGAPNSMLEALSYGVPVIGSDIPAHREILPEEHLIGLDDMRRWRQVLREILDDPENRLRDIAKKQSIKARDFVFEWDKVVVDLVLQ